MNAQDRAGDATPLWIAAGVALGWLMAAPLILGRSWSGAVYAELLFERPAALWLPVIAAFVAAGASLLAGSGRRPPALPAQADLDEAAAALDHVAARVRALREALAGDVAGLAQTADALAARLETARDELGQAEAVARATEAGTRSLGEAIAAAAAAAETAATAMRTTRADAAEGAAAAESVLARLGAAQAALAEEASAAASRLGSVLEVLEQQAAETAERLGERTDAIEAAARGALAETERAAARLAETVAAQAETLAGAAAEARRTLEQLGAEAAQQVSRRLEALGRAAGEIEGRLARQLSATDAIGTSAERAFQLLDARLQHSASASASTLETLAGRVQAVHERIDALGGSIQAARQAIGELDAAAGALDAGTQTVLERLSEEVPARAQEARALADTMRADVSALVEAVERAAASAAALSGPVGQGRAALEEAAAAFDRQRDSVRVAGEALVVELEQARQLIAEVEQATEATSLAAATRLVDAMTRVREVAQQTTGTLREMLAGVIGEARETLTRTAAEALETSFARPIAAEAEAASAAARAAAERAAASMAALASTIRLLEDRAEASRGALEEAAQRELAAAAGFLTDRLASASVSIASALGQPMTDEDWARWRRGERTLFRRRAVALLDRADRERLRTLIAGNPDFAEAARAYTMGFEALLARFDRIGAPGIAAALLDSDSGRLAAALTEALED